jgi:CHASE2 domain-containing sensor protein/tRNA A-37 threonylcarbamoyl transferase component Bud32
MTRLGAIFRRKDWVPGVLAVAAVLGLHAVTDTVQRLERAWYDHGIRAAARAPSDELAVIAIDDASIARLGSWPWSRQVHAQMIERLSAAGAKGIVLALPLSEPQLEPGVQQLQQLAEVVGSDVELATHPVLPLLLEQSLDADAHLLRAVRASRRTLLAAQVPDLPAGTGPSLSPMPMGALNSTLPDPGAGVLKPMPYAKWPLPALAAAAAGVGHTAGLPDPDGVLRTQPLALAQGGRAVPSLALLAAAWQRGLPVTQLQLQPGGPLQLGPLRLPTEGAALVRNHFYAGQDAQAAPFPHDAFHAVHSGLIPAARYARKTVLIGVTAPGLASPVATPVSPAMSALDVLAHQTASLLSGHVIARPAWFGAAAAAALLLVLAHLVLVVPRLAALSALALSTVLAIGGLAVGHLLLTQASLWLPSVLPVVALAAGQAAMTLQRLLQASAAPQDSDATGVQALRQLGLQLQEQGQHELAWEQLRRVPLALLEPEQASSLMERLYELGLNFEHRGQFAPAQAVYAHLVRHDQAYRDVAQRMLRTRSAARDSEPGTPSTPPALALASPAGTPAMLQPAAPATAGGPPVARPGAGPTTAPPPPGFGNGPGAHAPAPLERRTLGRFRIERELGRGAMGAVYLGLDPQWNRPVAIKTMALSQEFGGEQLEDARQRFLREAETAGRLRHPDIVTIFDAGEDRDLAYIAMELLSGQDLTHHTRVGQLLPVPQVLELTARVAEALAYAHKHGVVHRDVKPANVMIDLARGQVKVTDFGIARITDSSKTRTGAVLGTPSYMSPEQLAGRRLDGRSDLYSLGVMLFQLLTGQLPLRGESMAALMYAIANTPAPDVRSMRPELPQTLAEVVALALEKRPEVRYADGQQLALDLRTVAGMMQAPEPGGAAIAAPEPAAVPPAASMAAEVALPPAAAVPASAEPAVAWPEPAAAPDTVPQPLPEEEAAAPVAAAPRPSPHAEAAPAAQAPSPPAKGVQGVWRSSVRKARRDAQAELFADTQPSMPVPLDDDGFGHNRPG